MMKKIVTCFFFLFFLASLSAQKEGVAGFIKLGYLNEPSSGNVFKKIAPDGVSDFTNRFAMFGAEVYYRQARTIFTAEGIAGTQKRRSSGCQYAEPYQAAAHVRIGRVISEGKRYWLYPSMGAGASTVILLSYQKVNGRIEEMKQTSLVAASFDIGISGDFLLSKLKWNEGYYLGSIAGIRAGYRTAIRSQQWKGTDNLKSDNLPYYANRAFYISLLIGGGSFDKK